MHAALFALHPFAAVGDGGFAVHWSTVIGILALGGLYASRARVAPPRPAQIAAFGGGLLTLFLALNGPLHDLSDVSLFSAHMVQHLLLIFVVAPLLIIGTPGAMLRPALAWPIVGPAARWLTRPAVCFVTFNVVLAGWHLPPLYNLAMAVHPVHIVEHLMFLAVAVMMWWPILSPLPELPRLAYPDEHPDVDRRGLHLARRPCPLSRLRRRTPRLGPLAAAGPAVRRPDHVDSRRARALRADEHRLLQVGRVRRGLDGGRAGRLAADDVRPVAAVAALVAVVALGACGESATVHYARTVCAESADTGVIPVAIRTYIASQAPLPRRFAYVPGTDSSPTDAVIAALQDKGPTYLYSLDPALQGPVKKQLHSLGDYPTLLLWYHGVTHSDATHAVVSLSGAYVGDVNDRAPTPLTAVAVHCDSAGWQAPLHAPATAATHPASAAP
jgi:hypothetical protein